jgi:hypothetical protein
MRKCLQVVGIAALALLVAAPAMAIDFTMAGSYRVRIYSADGIGSETGSVTTSPFAKSAPNARNQADARFRPWFIVKDDNGKIESGVRFEIGDINFGSAGGGNTGTDGVNIETKWMYLDFEVPGLQGARLRAGLQGFYLPKGMILDDDAAGLTLKGKAGIAGYEAFWFVVNDIVNGGTVAVGGTNVGPANDDIDVYGAKVGFNINSAINPYLYGVYRHGSVAQAVNIGTTPSTASADGWWIGLGAMGRLGVVNYDLDFVYGVDEPHVLDGVGAAVTREGWMVDGGIEAPVGPVALGLRFTYATGDDAATIDNEDFPSIRGTTGGNLGNYGPKASQIFWYSGDSTYFRGGFCSQCANNYAFGAYVQYQPVKALMTRLAYFYIGATKANTNFFTGKSQIGQEISFVSEYTLYTGFKLWAVAGILLTPNSGNNIAPGAGGGVELKDVTLFSVGMRHDF